MAAPELIDGETINYQGIACELSIASPASSVVVVTISGLDIGEFGSMPTARLENYFSDQQAVELFIDARRTRGASIDVSGDWAVWLGAHRSHFKRINMLTGSRFIEVTADFVRRFSRLEDVMRIYTDAKAFDKALAVSIAETKHWGVGA